MLVRGKFEPIARLGLLDFEIRIVETAADVLGIAHTTQATAIIFAGELAGFDHDVRNVVAANGIKILAFQGCLPDEFGATSVNSVVDIKEAIAQEIPAPIGEISGRMISVWGPLGSPGRTTIAINLAAEWQNESVLLIDADSYGAAVGQHLNLLDEVSGVLAAARAATQGRLASVRDFAIEIDQRWSVLTGLPRPDLWRSVRPGAWREVLSKSLFEYQVVLVDVGFCFENDQTEVELTPRNHMAISALAKSESVLAVGGSDPIALARLIRELNSLEEVCPDLPISILINGHDNDLGFPQREVVRTVTSLTKRSPLALLPRDDLVRQGLARGVTAGEVAPRSAFRQGILQLAATL